MGFVDMYELDELIKSALEGQRDAQIRVIELLKSEDPDCTKEILTLFREGNKEAAEIIVRTFYPYAENLLVMLEKKNLHHKIYSYNGVAPSLTTNGSNRVNFLNNFFLRFVSGAANLNLDEGIKIYIFRSLMSNYDDKSRSNAAFSIPKEVEKPRLTGISLATKGPVKEGRIKEEKTRDLSRPGSGLSRYGGVTSSVARAKVTPNTNERDNKDVKMVTSKRVRSVVSALSDLAQKDLYAYRVLSLRYFVGRTFSQLCNDFGVEHSSEIGLKLLDGLLFIDKNSV
ncbi:hypothetical protein IJT10_04790 [bacterium]|nr:hypothetical protein [bacterium]